MLRREGRSPAHLLSLLAGLAILGYLVVAVASVAFDSPQIAAWVLLAFPLVVTAGLLFTGVLVTSLVHARLARRHLGDARAIVVLGAGLIAGRVPPLLAGRLREGARVADLVRASHPSAPLIVSGGRGADEPTAEGHAMRAWYTEHPELAADPVLVEDRSHTTEENLRLSAALLAEHGVTGPLVAVTSDYHALRAATLLRRLGLPGDAVGARTAAYYRPSAFLREVVCGITGSSPRSSSPWPRHPSRSPSGCCSWTPSADPGAGHRRGGRLQARLGAPSRTPVRRHPTARSRARRDDPCGRLSRGACCARRPSAAGSARG